MDLRARVVQAIDGGLSCRQAAERFDVSPSSAIRWHHAWRTRGSYVPRACGGDRLSHKTEQHAGDIHAVLDAEADITLRELKAELSRRGISVSVAALWRYFRRHQITHKKRPATQRSRTDQTF
ncbi:MAG: hypothetical protein AcusKO_42100 [Acuticoccus sp.]